MSSASATVPPVVRIGARLGPVLSRLSRASGRDETAARAAFFDEARSLTHYLSVEVRGHTFFVATDDRLGRAFFVRRRRPDFSYLERAVRHLSEHGLFRDGSTFVDVGANIGTTTVDALARHGLGSAIVLEPEPDTFRALRLNLVANDVDSVVTALQVAASNQEGDVQLASARRTSAESTLAPLALDRSAKLLTVPAVTLDGLVERGVIDPRAVGLLWVDGRGAEALVLEGSARLLGEGVPIVAAVRPDLPRWSETKEELVRRLGGYTHFAALSRRRDAPVGALGPLLDGLQSDSRLLAFRR